MEEPAPYACPPARGATLADERSGEPEDLRQGSLRAKPGGPRGRRRGTGDGMRVGSDPGPGKRHFREILEKNP